MYPPIDMYKIILNKSSLFWSWLTHFRKHPYAYIDDLLIASKDEQQHLKDLRVLFQRLSEYGLNIKPSKCTFGVTIIDFLGHNISQSGIRPSDEKIAAIRIFERPKSIKQPRKFIGMVNYYHRYIPKLAEYTNKIYDLISLYLLKWH